MCDRARTFGGMDRVLHSIKYLHSREGPNYTTIITYGKSGATLITSLNNSDYEYENSDSLDESDEHFESLVDSDENSDSIDESDENSDSMDESDEHSDSMAESDEDSENEYHMNDPDHDCQNNGMMN